MEQVTQTEAPPRHHQLGLSDDDVLAMYRQMLMARAVDERMWLMQRAGKIAFIISGQGHEGAQVAIAWPMRRSIDWMAPTTAPSPAPSPSAWTRGHHHRPPRQGRRRQLRRTPDARPLRRRALQPGQPLLAGRHQVLHAVGIAMGAWVRGDDVVAMTSYEGTSNQGEIHEAMNFAGVHKLPVIFVCENNGYAISVPLDKQVGGGRVAVRRRAMASRRPGRRVRSAGLLRGRQGGSRPRLRAAKARP